MSTQIVTAGPGDPCTYPIGTCDPQCIDYEALMSMDESNHDDIVRELEADKYETQVERQEDSGIRPVMVRRSGIHLLALSGSQKKERRPGKNAGVLPTHAVFQSFDQLRNRRMRKRQN